MRVRHKLQLEHVPQLGMEVAQTAQEVGVFKQ